MRFRTLLPLSMGLNHLFVEGDGKLEDALAAVVAAGAVAWVGAEEVAFCLEFDLLVRRWGVVSRCSWVNYLDSGREMQRRTQGTYCRLGFSGGKRRHAACAQRAERRKAGVWMGGSRPRDGGGVGPAGASLERAAFQRQGHAGLLNVNAAQRWVEDYTEQAAAPRGALPGTVAPVVSSCLHRRSRPRGIAARPHRMLRLSKPSTAHVATCAAEGGRGSHAWVSAWAAGAYCFAMWGRCTGRGRRWTW
jgi:hypothetical protein